MTVLKENVSEAHNPIVYKHAERNTITLGAVSSNDCLASNRVH